jgi:hypothetical protein
MNNLQLALVIVGVAFTVLLIVAIISQCLRKRYRYRAGSVNYGTDYSD